MTKTDTYTVKWSTLAILGLIGLLTMNFLGDYTFRGAQIEINSDFILMHNSTNILTGALSVVVIDLNEKVEIILDELFDTIWEDLEQT